MACAAALQVATAVHKGEQLFCEELPPMDMDIFLRSLAERQVDASGISLALVGYGVSGTDLGERMAAMGVPVGHVTSDLHMAAKWRNDPSAHPNIVALARGRHPGVSTLAHFPRGDTRAFARDLLRWASKTEAELVSTMPQRELLSALADNAALAPLVSLSGVTAFLATWEESRAEDELGAPRRALPQLGMLPDRNVLVAPDAIAERLLRNFNLTQEITRMTGARIEDVRRKVRRAAPEDRTRWLEVIERAVRIRRVGDLDSLSALEYEDALAVFREPIPEDVPDEPPDEPPDPPIEIEDGPMVAAAGGELLIDGDDDALAGLVDGIRTALADAVDGDEDSASGQYGVGDEERGFEFEIERDVLTWVHHFCSEDAWGGFFESATASFEEAIGSYAQCEPIQLRPVEASIPHVGERYSLRDLLEAMEQELQARGVTSVALGELWDAIIAARRDVRRHLDMLIHQPMLGVAGDRALASAVADLLSGWEQFYSKLAQHHPEMHEIDHAWTQQLFEVVASLDVVQIKANLGSGRTSWKAVLLPTHPLHLWRYERMAALTRGMQLAGMDRVAVLEQLKNPEHYLGVIYLTSVPEGRGGRQGLPVARDYRGLAVFENLKNAYSGSDGVDVLRQCVQQFEQIYVNHARPLRLALVNPPNASQTLVALLARGRGRPAGRARLVVDVYATPDHEDRLLGAYRFAPGDRDQIEEHIAAGRLQLRVHEEILALEDRIAALKNKPVHILAVFDEATTAMRHQPGGVNLLPMSPFAIRRQVTFQGIQRKVELLPTHDETVFRFFYDMVARLRGAHFGETPQASADADRIATGVDEALAEPEPSALWFFFADRALPAPSGVGAARILERRDGRRRCVCYDVSYERLALLLRPPLDEFNLRFSHEELVALLEEGVALVGEGLIELFGPDAKADPVRVLGFAGLLVAARDYRDRHGEALLVSVDTPLARLWLRLSDQTQRCDLMALRREEGALIVDAIEVKTSGQEAGVAREDIKKASAQLGATLEAVASGLAPDEEGSPLTAPRQEMLKEVFVSGCQALAASREDRTRWAQWLEVLFRQAESGDEIRLAGTVYAVELRSNSPSVEETLKGEPCDVGLRRIRERRIQNLLSPGSPGAVPPGDEGAGQGADDSSAGAESQPPGADAEGLGNEVSPGQSVATPERGSDAAGAATDAGIRFVVGHSASAGDGRPYHLHPSNTRLNQLNIGVVGDLGTGKTQLTKALIHEFARRGDANRGHVPKFLIFDYKRDYTKPDFVEAVGARVVTPLRIPLNVFDLPDGRSHPRAARLGRVKFVNDVLQKIYGGIGPRQRNHVKNAIMQAYEENEPLAPTLADVVERYGEIVGDRIDSPYSILSDLVDLEVFVDEATQAEPFDRFFEGVTVVDLAELGVGEKERNMLVVLFLNFYFEYMINLEKQPYLGSDPQCRFIDSMLLVDEADNIMKYNFDVLRQILLQGREFGVGVLLASQFLSHFRTREMDYAEPLLSWFVHKVPNVTPKELQSIGLSRVSPSIVDRVKSLDVHQCLFKTLDVPGRFMRGRPFYEIDASQA